MEFKCAWPNSNARKPMEDATILKAQLVDYLADTKDHSVSDSFVKILWERKNEEGED